MLQPASFDPYGDHHERDDALQLAIDHDPSTAWETERYRTPDISFKQGVGLIVFGPDRGRFGRWRFRRAARRLRSSAGCLVWPFD